MDRIVNEINKIQKKHIVIAIDGHAGAGKSTLAKNLSRHFDSSIIRMDDFFLPFDMRSQSRLYEAGGNVHYERFCDEVIKNLGKSELFYRRFDCKTGTYSELVRLVLPRVTIIEGSYSHHPYFGDAYDLRIFLDISPELQKKRILERDGKDKLTHFISKWIPMENKYFEEFKIKEKSNIIVKAE